MLSFSLASVQRVNTLATSEQSHAAIEKSDVVPLNLLVNVPIGGTH